MADNKGYRAFCEFAKNKSFSLIGAGVSNLPLIPFLKECGVQWIVLRDSKKKESDPEIQFALAHGVKIRLGNDFLQDLDEDVILRSPGIRPDLPAFQEAVSRGASLYVETELFLKFAPCRTIGITGSDGKTTTTTLISKILEAEGYQVLLGGNIGKAMLPQLSLCGENQCFSVTELSSFQLMNATVSPDVAVITNLSENHLDWHRDMAEYLDAKENILRFQNAESRVVLNYDCADTRKLKSAGDTVYFSSKSKDAHCFVNDGSIYLGKEKILSVEQILLPGWHNIENYMAAISATAPFVSPESVRKVATQFGGVSHRIELVRERNRVRYYNSSIDSSPTRSIACLRSFSQKVIMIAGGYDKNLDYTPLGEEICKRVKVLILCGATSAKIEDSVTKCTSPEKPQVIHCEKFSQVAKLASILANEGDVVVLSPASASFDLFRNFEERGDFFRKTVMELE